MWGEWGGFSSIAVSLDQELLDAQSYLVMVKQLRVVLPQLLFVH